jgi:salicylate hydroxylase
MGERLTAAVVVGEVGADVLIAADGIHSTLQRFVAGQVTPVFSGQISYRGVLDTSRVPWWPARVFQVWMGEGKHVIVFPVRAGRMLNFWGGAARQGSAAAGA